MLLRLSVAMDMVPAFSTADFMATPPSFDAGSEAKLLWNDPMGVRCALTITTS